MQLNPSRIDLRGQLAAATVALLGVAAPSAHATEGTSSALLYAEPNRVTAFETRADFRRDLERGRILRLHVALDALTGASPNGALRARVPQTFTAPSGSSTYRVEAGQTPLDNTFQDTRLAGGLDLEIPLNRLTRTTVGLNLSAERDYFSAGGNVTLARDLFGKNTTVSVGLSGSLDTVMPLGGTPVPFASPPPVSPLREDEHEGEDVPQGSESKRVADALVGVTQILNRSTLMQVNYSVSRSSGYLTDPYKLVTVAYGPESPLAGDPVAYVHEKRPDTRRKQALFWEGKHTFGRDVFDLSFRYLWDDWGIHSRTIEARYLWELSERNGIEPQVRSYRQDAADFYTPSLVDGAALPNFASADTRLSKLDAWTGALKYVRKLDRWGELGLRVGYYVQTGESHPASAIGSQKDQDLSPKVTAVLSQVSYSFRL